jgi:putative effector of murein hydrolase LrgA (UPF0299 family)
LPHYILFIWPGLALSVAATIAAQQNNTLTSRDRKWLRSGVWFFGTAAVLIAAGLIAGPWFTQVKSLRLSGAISGIVLLAMAARAIRFQLAEKFTQSVKTLLAGFFIFLITLLFGVLPGLEQTKITPFISQAINKNTAADVPVTTYKFAEPSLNFYIGRKIEKLNDKEAVISWASRPQAGVLIIPADILADILQGSGPLPLFEIASKEGFNYSNGKKVKILAMIRGKENPK